MCNPILMGLLLREKRILDLSHTEMYADGGWSRYITGKDNPSALQVFLAELPEQRAWEARALEEAARAAAGGKEICPNCGDRSVKSSDVCTLGYPGHPGAEFSVYRKCVNERCDFAEL